MLLCIGLFITTIVGLFENGSALPRQGGVTYEYTPPSVKGDHVFIAVLEPTSGINKTVAQFMYHVKHEMYSSGFLSETFLLGIGNTHAFDDEKVDFPDNELRRISITIGILWTQLTMMRAINRLALKCSNDTAHYFLQSGEGSDTFRYLFHGLEEAVRGDPQLRETYIEEKKKVESYSLPPLKFANISLAKFIGIERKLEQRVWNDSTVFLLVAHARFSQYAELSPENVTQDDYERLLTAHSLVETASDPELRQDAQKAYNEAIADSVNTSSEILKQRDYDQFDRVLFSTLDKIIPTYSKMFARYKLLKQKARSESFIAGNNQIP